MWHMDEDGYKLDNEVRKMLLTVATDFVTSLKKDHELKVKIHDLVIIGSVANYNWTDYSDIDLHIVVDFSSLEMSKDDAQTMFDAIKTAWNLKHDIKMKGHDVELYVQDIDHEAVSTAEYSVLNDKWNKEPKKENPEFNKALIKRKYKEFKKQIDTLIKDRDEGGLKKLLEKLYKYRQAGLDRGGELSEENIVFKILRAKGHLDKIKDGIANMYDKKMSVDETDSHITLSKGGYDLDILRVANEILDYAKEHKKYPDLNPLLNPIVIRYNKDIDVVHKDVTKAFRRLNSILIEDKIDDGISSPDGKTVIWDYDENEGEFSLVPTDDDTQRRVFSVYGIPVFAAYRVMSKGVTAMAHSDDEGSRKMAHDLVNIRTAIKHPEKGSKKTVSELVDISIDRLFNEQKIDASKVNFLIPLGSKSKLNLEVARKIKKRLPNAIILEDFLKKDTWKNVKLSPLFWKSVRRRKKEGKPIDWYIGFAKTIQRKKEAHPNELFGIKNVSPTTRMYFSMFYRTNDDYFVDAMKVLKNANVLLIDDTLEAGSTLVEAARALNEYEINSLAAYIFLYGRDIKIAPAVPIGKK